ncbi:uncharacterized protein LOC143245356 [Tachypleus tridentatus]|uniref:uncharacterized protein LOC143245356 n=1 Tax=Tachypleus tridentatus TaxID=6853 RepID=UPI003FD4EF77
MSNSGNDDWSNTGSKITSFKNLRLRQIALGVLPTVKKEPEEDEMLNSLRRNLSKVLALSEQEACKTADESNSCESDNSEKTSPQKLKKARTKKSRRASVSKRGEQEVCSKTELNHLTNQSKLASAKSRSCKKANRQTSNASSKTDPRENTLKTNQNSVKLKNEKRKRGHKQSVKETSYNGKERNLPAYNELPQFDVVTMVSQVSVSDNEAEGGKSVNIVACHNSNPLPSNLVGPLSPWQLEENISKQFKIRKTKKKKLSIDSEQHVKHKWEETESQDEKLTSRTSMCVSLNKSGSRQLNIFENMTEERREDEFSQNRELIEIKEPKNVEHTVEKKCRKLFEISNQTDQEKSFSKIKTSSLNHVEKQLATPLDELTGSAKECWSIHQRLKAEELYIPLTVLQRALMTPTEIREVTKPNSHIHHSI